MTPQPMKWKGYAIAGYDERFMLQSHTRTPWLVATPTNYAEAVPVVVTVRIDKRRKAVKKKRRAALAAKEEGRG